MNDAKRMRMSDAFYREILWIGNPEKLHVLGKFGKWRAPNRLLPGIGVVRIIQITLSDLKREKELMHVLNRIGRITDGKRKTKKEKIQSSAATLTLVPQSSGGCPKCSGLLVPCLLRDYYESGYKAVWGKSCVPCGYVTDSGIERNKMIQIQQQQARQKEMLERGPYKQHQNLPVCV